MNTKQGKVKSIRYSLWLFFNIIAPLMPVILKLFISIAGNEGSFSIDILDSSELIYYNFVICTVYMFDTMERNEKELIDVLFGFGAFFIVILDIAMLIMIYSKTERDIVVSILAVIMSILTPIVAAIRKYREGNL